MSSSVQWAVIAQQRDILKVLYFPCDMLGMPRGQTGDFLKKIGLLWRSSHGLLLAVLYSQDFKSGLQMYILPLYNITFRLLLPIG